MLGRNIIPARAPHDSDRSPHLAGQRHAAAHQGADRLRARRGPGPGRAFLWSRANAPGLRLHGLPGQAVRTDLPEPAFHAGDSVDVLGAGAGRGGNGRHRQPGPARLEDAELHRGRHRHRGGHRPADGQPDPARPAHGSGAGEPGDGRIRRQGQRDREQGPGAELHRAAGQHRPAQRARGRDRRQAEAGRGVLRAAVRHRPGDDAESGHRRLSRTRCRGCSRSA